MNTNDLWAKSLLNSISTYKNRYCLRHLHTKTEWMKLNAVITLQISLCGVSSCSYRNHRAIFTHAATSADTENEKRYEEWRDEEWKKATDWDTEPSEKYLWWVTIVIFRASSLLQKYKIVFWLIQWFCSFRFLRIDFCWLFRVGCVLVGCQKPNCTLNLRLLLFSAEFSNG